MTAIIIGDFVGESLANAVYQEEYTISINIRRQIFHFSSDIIAYL